MAKNNIYIFLCFLLYWNVGTLSAQSNIVGSGGEATGSGGIASYSIGQIDYITQTGSNGTASQGVQQPYEFYIVGIDAHKSITLEMSVFPNPTPSSINLTVSSGNFEALTYQLYTINGKLLTHKQINNAATSISMETLPPATYLLKVMNKQQAVKTFKIVKN